jgi:selenium metabolism protein YedF
MAEKTVVDARGEACPLPVVHAAKALAGMTGGVLEVLVDNEIAVQNLERMASGKGLKCTAAKAEGGFAVEIEAASGAAQPEAAPACAPDKRGELVIAVDTDRMGRGDDKLGALLMKSFLFAVTQLPELPRKMIFYNGGAKLTTEGSESLADLRTLEAQGVDILTCGTCLNFYGLTEKLAVGRVSNMYEIAETLAAAGKVVKP